MACTRPGSFRPSPPTQLCAERACPRLPRAAGSSRRRGQPWQKHMPCSTPVQPGLDGDDNLDIGSVKKDCLDELDAGSDDGRSVAAAAAAFAALRHQALRTTRPGRRSRSGRRARRACCVWQHPAALALWEPPMRTCRCHALIAAARAQMRSHHRGRRRQESDVAVLTNPNTTIEKSSLTIDKSLCFGNVCPRIGMYHLKCVRTQFPTTFDEP